MVATGQEIAGKKILQGQGKFSEFNFESGKIEILKRNQGIHFSCHHCFVEAIIKMPSCDFLKIYQWVRRTTLRGLEAATVCYSLCLFGHGNFIFIREKSGNLCTLMSVATMK